MQFGKVYIDPKANFSKEEFAELVKGKDIGGMDRHEAWKMYYAKRPITLEELAFTTEELAVDIKPKKKKEEKLPEWQDDSQQDTQI